MATVSSKLEGGNIRVVAWILMSNEDPVILDSQSLQDPFAETSLSATTQNRGKLHIVIGMRQLYIDCWKSKTLLPIRAWKC